MNLSLKRPELDVNHFAGKNIIRLTGCRTEPLSDYLKALGVMRLIAKQKDPDVRGCWTEDGYFELSSNILDEEGLVKFFLEEYKPSPIVAAWQGGTGMLDYEKDTKKAIVSALENSKNDKLDNYRDAIEKVKKLLKDKNIEEKPKDEEKFNVQSAFRSELDDDLVEWIDALIVITSEKTKYPPLLGVGGADGNLSQTKVFMESITYLGIHKEKVSDIAKPLLESSLFEKIGSIPKSISLPVGYLNPIKAGGKNSSFGFDRDSIVNPWDFLLCLEGGLLFSGAVSRRKDSNSSKSSYPFTVDSSFSGFGSSVDSEDSRGEIWLPLWFKATSFSELAVLMSEGRSELNGRQTKDGLGFVLSLSSLGVDKGIDSFVRYAIMVRNGLSYFAVPLGSYSVGERPDIDIITEFTANWLDRYKYNSGGNNSRYMVNYRRIADRIFDYVKNPSESSMNMILRAIGLAEKDARYMKGDKSRMPYLKLSPDWIDASNDKSPEFRLALSLASLDSGEKYEKPLRVYLEPIGKSSKGNFLDWADSSTDVVWSFGNPVKSMTEILKRRIIDTDKNVFKIPVSGFCYACLSDVFRFIEGDLDLMKFEELVYALSTISPFEIRKVTQNNNNLYPKIGEPAHIPLVYSVTKLLFTEHISKDREEPIKAEGSIVPLLLSNQLDSACTISARRLFMDAQIRGKGESVVPAVKDYKDSNLWHNAPENLAAALLFPLSYEGVLKLVKQISVRNEE
jgi:CRISPR-associated protein Csx17